MKLKICDIHEIGAHFAYLPVTLYNSIDIADLDGGSVAEITFPNPNDLTSFRVKVKKNWGGFPISSIHKSKLMALYSLNFWHQRLSPLQLLRGKHTTTFDVTC